MTKNIKQFTSLIEDKGRELGNEHAYCAGYYESVLSRLAEEIPEVAEFLDRRVNYLNNQKKAA